MGQPPQGPAPQQADDTPAGRGRHHAEEERDGRAKDQAERGEHPDQQMLDNVPAEVVVREGRQRWREGQGQHRDPRGEARAAPAAPGAHRPAPSARRAEVEPENPQQQDEGEVDGRATDDGMMFRVL